MQDKYPILYSFKRCPYAIRARMALAFAKIDHIHREINLKEKHAVFLETSPKGTVPVWVDNKNNLIIDESIEIVRHAFTQYIPSGWGNTEVLDQDEFNELYNQLLNTFIPATRKIKYALHDSSESPEQLASYANQLLIELNERLSKQPFIFGKPSPADIVLFPNIRQLIIHDSSWCEKYQLPYLKKWLTHWIEHEVFKVIFINQPVWSPSQKPILICYE